MVLALNIKGPTGPQGPKGDPLSIPPLGFRKVVNIYVNPITQKFVVQYEEEGMTIQTMLLDPSAQSYADLDDLDSAAATKLAGIEAGATGDQTGAEIRDLIVGIADVDRKIVITTPTTGQFKVISVQRQADGKFASKYDDVAA